MDQDIKPTNEQPVEVESVPEMPVEETSVAPEVKTSDEVEVAQLPSEDNSENMSEVEFPAEEQLVDDVVPAEATEVAEAPVEAETVTPDEVTSEPIEETPVPVVQHASICRIVVYRDSNGVDHPMIVESVSFPEDPLNQREQVSGYLGLPDSIGFRFVKDIPRNSGVNPSQDLETWDFPARV